MSEGIFDSELQDFGDGKSVFDVLQEFGNQIQSDLISSLDARKANDTFGLRQSIQFDITFLGVGYTFELRMNKYGDFIDQGVEGVGGMKADGSSWRKHSIDSPFRYKQNKIPSAEHFEGWAYRKRLNPFAVRESVFHRGLKPNHFYSEVVTEQRIEKLAEDLAQAGANEIMISLKNSLEESELIGIGR